MTEEVVTITALLSAWRDGDKNAENVLWERIYPHLRAISAKRLHQGGIDGKATLSLVHEAYVKLADQRADWENRAHFYAVAARVMRRVLSDHARACSRSRRGENAVHVSLEGLGLADTRQVPWVTLDSALKTLSDIDPVLTQVVELRLFIGFSAEETAQILNVGVATVGRNLRFSRAWLKTHLS